MQYRTSKARILQPHEIVMSSECCYSFQMATILENEISLVAQFYHARMVRRNPRFPKLAHQPTF
jgi:hypothetical protein